MAVSSPVFTLPTAEALAALGVPAVRVSAVRAVLCALMGFPGGRALAGELAAAVMALDPARPLSHRQAKRWLQWARTGAPGCLATDPKSDEGTWYHLVGATAGEAADMEAPLPELDGVPSALRAAVAGVLLALLAVGGGAGARELAGRMAEEAGRPVGWSALALDAAHPYLARVAEAWEQHVDMRVDHCYALPPDVTGYGLRAWGRPLDYALPVEPLARKREIRRRLAGARVRLDPGTAAVVGALAALGGLATREELQAWPYAPAERQAAWAALKDLEAAGGHPPLIALVRHRDRSLLQGYRLHAGLGLHV